MTENKKILIVDDTKEYLQTAMNYILEEEVPYELLGAVNGKMALEIAENEVPDLIIMDWEMPEMNGIEATRKLKQNTITKDIPVIIATGIRLTPQDLKTALEAGASDYIRKPLEKTEFIARINSHLKISEYIAEIKRQSGKLAKVEMQRLTNIIETLKNKVDENKASRTFHLNFLTGLIKQLEKINEDNHEKSNEIVHIISTVSHLLRQIKINTDCNSLPDDAFIKGLLKEHDELTPQEIQLSYMLKKGLSTKEIATLTFREESSVKVARSRLRKKLGLNDDDNLVTYLQKY